MSKTLSMKMQRWRVVLGPAVMRRCASDAVAERVQAPMLLRLRSELKTAMRARDTERLNVIKSVLAMITNSEKMNKPIDSDEKIRKYMLKQAEAQKTVAQQFETQHRTDLRDKELTQAAILESYAAEIKVVPKDQLKDAILLAIKQLESEGRTGNTERQTGNVGGIMILLRKKDGPLHGETFDFDQAIQIIKELGISGASNRKG